MRHALVRGAISRGLHSGDLEREGRSELLGEVKRQVP